MDFIAAISDQNEELSSEIDALGARISALVVTLEAEQFKVDQLSQERDLARTAFTALANQLEETRIIAIHCRDRIVGGESSCPPPRRAA